MAQKQICGFDDVNKNLKKNIQYVKQLELMEAKIQQKIQENKLKRSIQNNANQLAGPIYEIPVVVHIVYKSGEEAPNGSSHPYDWQIESAIDNLNAGFAAAQGSGNIGVSIPIKFTLAKRRPDCGRTSGIDRIDGSVVPGYDQYGLSLPGSDAPGGDATTIKKLGIWPVKQYYNIWIVWRINGNATGNSFYTGYTDLPINVANQTFHSFPLDGLVILGPYIYGKTFLHEMGHALGLYHSFEGGDEDNCPSNGDCATTGDRVCDTDPVKSLLFTNPCPQDGDPNPCKSGSNYNGIQNNIMGYGECLNRFTAGQRDRMIAALEAIRGGLTTSSAALEPPPVLVKEASQKPLSSVLEPGNIYNMGPCNVSLGNMNYTSYGSSLDGDVIYIDNSCNVGTILNPLVSQTLRVSTQTNEQVCKAWIDFNNDGVFGNDEIVMNSSTNLVPFTHESTITSAILSKAVKNTLLRMRVVADWVDNKDFGPASQLEDGQTEDFWIKVENSFYIVYGGINATSKNNTLTVKWSTNSEINIDRFIVEGAADGVTFKPISEVMSKAVNGSSSTVLQYELIAGTQMAVGASFGFLILLLAGFSRGKKRSWILVSGVLFIGLFVACNRKDIPVSNDPKTINYIRIASADKNGEKIYSNVIKVIKE